MYGSMVGLGLLTSSCRNSLLRLLDGALESAGHCNAKRPERGRAEAETPRAIKTGRQRTPVQLVLFALREIPDVPQSLNSISRVDFQFVC